MGLRSFLRREALGEELVGFGVDRKLAGPVAAAVNKYIVEGFLMKAKPGWKTTEFWLSLFTAAGAGFAAVGHVLPPQWAAITGAVITAGYSIARGLAKANPAAPSTEPPKGID